MAEKGWSVVKGRLSTFVLICGIGCSVSTPRGMGMVECAFFRGCRKELREGEEEIGIITRPFCPIGTYLYYFVYQSYL